MTLNTDFRPPMTKPWSAIVRRYAETPNVETSVCGIAALARHIEETELSIGLYGWTSMFDLCITQTEVAYPYLGPYLRVKPMLDGNIEFRYFDTLDQSKQWHRTVPAKDAIRRPRSFLGQLHWFASTSPANDA
jgi:hypothetical protein